MHYEPLLRLFAYAPDLTQGRPDLRLAPEISVMRDSESVGFIPYMLHHFQCLRIPVQKQRMRVPHPYDFLKTFGQSDDGKAVCNSKLAQSLVSTSELSFASCIVSEFIRMFSLGMVCATPLSSASLLFDRLSCFNTFFVSKS